MISAKRKRINHYLKKYGLPETFEIEKEMEDTILLAFRTPGLVEVKIDSEGYLHMEFDEDNEQRTI